MLPARFIDRARLEFFEDGRHALLLSSLTYIDHHGKAHIAHKGEVTDGGTLPTWLYSGRLGTPYTRYLRAYVIHDHDCAQAEILLAGGAIEEFKAARLAADKLYLEMITVIDTERGHTRWRDWYRRRKHYRGVRVGARRTLGTWKQTGNLDRPRGVVYSV